MSDDLLCRGQMCFRKMRVGSRNRHVVKHVLDLAEAWWDISELTRSDIERISRDFEAAGIPCGRGAEGVAMLPAQLTDPAASLYADLYEVVHYVVLSDLVDQCHGVSHTPSLTGGVKVEHPLLAVRVILDDDQRVRTAYRTGRHPAASGARERARIHVRRARWAASLQREAGGLE